MDEAREVLDACAARGLTLAVAETDTGGLVLEALTAIPGSSRVVLGGLVPYHDQLKQSLLGLSSELLAVRGAVSPEVAAAMAHAVRELAHADIGLATTGIAGPGGATNSKPVGLAYVAAASVAGALIREHRWTSDRASNRRASARAVLALALELVKKS